MFNLSSPLYFSNNTLYLGHNTRGSGPNGSLVLLPAGGSMQEWIAAFTAGLLAMTNPCVLPLYPGFLAYLSGQGGQTRQVSPVILGALVFLGVLSMMLALGALLAMLSMAVIDLVFWITPLSYLIIIFLGGLLLLNYNPFMAMAQLQLPVLQNPYANAFVYGLLYGPLAFPCSGPLLVFIFVQSLTVGERVEQIALFFVFGLGFGLPLFLLALLGQSQQRRLIQLFTEHYPLLNRVAGMLLVGIGLYGFWQEWALLSLYF